MGIGRLASSQIVFTDSVFEVPVSGNLEWASYRDTFANDFLAHGTTERRVKMSLKQGQLKVTTKMLSPEQKQQALVTTSR
jgi:hypothetical protein